MLALTSYEVAVQPMQWPPSDLGSCGSAECRHQVTKYDFLVRVKCLGSVIGELLNVQIEHIWPF